jgi:hypothetical protein
VASPAASPEATSTTAAGSTELPRLAPVSKVHGNGGKVTLQRGIYGGDLILLGNDNHVVGAGSSHTIVEGRLILRGNGNRVEGLTVRGPSEVTGNRNVIQNIAFQSNVTVLGNDNVR